jgi:hypothetical protein
LNWLIGKNPPAGGGSSGRHALGAIIAIAATAMTTVAAQPKNKNGLGGRELFHSFVTADHHHHCHHYRHGDETIDNSTPKQRFYVAGPSINIGVSQLFLWLCWPALACCSCERPRPPEDLVSFLSLDEEA